MKQPPLIIQSKHRLEKTKKKTIKTLQLLMIPLTRKLTSSTLLQSKSTTLTLRSKRMLQAPLLERRRSKALVLTMKMSKRNNQRRQKEGPSVPEV
jgi:hypothetical protein